MNTSEKTMSFKDLINSDTPVLVDFYASWCGPCKMLAPVLQELAGKWGDKIKIVKIDVDRNQGASGAYKVRGVPTLILFKNGEQLWRKSGYLSTAQLENELKGYLN